MSDRKYTTAKRRMDMQVTIIRGLKLVRVEECRYLAYRASVAMVMEMEAQVALIAALDKQLGHEEIKLNRLREIFIDACATAKPE